MMNLYYYICFYMIALNCICFSCLKNMHEVLWFFNYQNQKQQCYFSPILLWWCYLERKRRLRWVLLTVLDIHFKIHLLLFLRGIHIFISFNYILMHHFAHESIFFFELFQYKRFGCIYLW